MHFHKSGQYFNVVYTVHCVEFNLKKKQVYMHQNV